MARHSKKIMIGLGEILWDLLPDGKVLGGAPANFAYHAAALGNLGIPVSRVGQDDLGLEILQALQARAIPSEFIQIDPRLPTSTVEVKLADDGQPAFIIKENVAWDQVQFREDLLPLTQTAAAICFGTLAQRSPVSRKSIMQLLAAAPADTVKIFDINIRQHYYSAEVIRDSLRCSTILKLNESELPLLVDGLKLSHAEEIEQCRELLQKYDLRLVCLTKGRAGSILVSAEECAVHPGCAVETIDAVGAGDAFTAAIAHHVLKGSSLARMSDAANQLGAFVASRAGATPVIGEDILREVM